MARHKTTLSCEHCRASFVTEYRSDRDQRFCSKQCSGDSRREPASVRFWRMVNKNGPVPTLRPDLGPCWLWMGYCVGGYGCFSESKNPGGSRLAYRWAYEDLIGPIPEGLEPDHLCRNRSCVNPTHLEPVTPLVNMLRGESFAAVNARKTHCKRGHAFTSENTIERNSGARECRACQKNRNNRRQVSH